MRKPLVLAWSFLLLSACGEPAPDADADADADGDTDTDAPDDPPPAPIALTGTVWAPGDQAVSIAGARVYLADQRPAPPPDGAFCATCVELPPGAVLSDPRGDFTLPPVAAGTTVWLVVEKGPFRIEREIVVAPELAELPADLTSLVARTDAAAGDFAPRIALAVGSSDRVADLLAKLGFGVLAPNGTYVPDSAPGQIDAYWNGGAMALGDGDPTSFAALITDLDAMLRYHVILIPCSREVPEIEAVLRKTSTLRNLRAYVASGGHLMASDRSAEWVDFVFPSAIELYGMDVHQDGNDTPGQAFDIVTSLWYPNLFGASEGWSDAGSRHATADDALAAWLAAQTAVTGPLDPADFELPTAGTVIAEVHSVLVSILPDVLEDSPIVHVEGETLFATPLPLAVSFKPVGRGRVTYTTFHASHEPHLGLDANELVATYLLMETGAGRPD